jgi:hypothetical protein
VCRVAEFFLSVSPVFTLVSVHPNIVVLSVPII